MRSGNGRHRRPRQAPAFVVTAGVTGAGLALPLFAASAAHAADSGTWDRVAQCESGGLWSANSGNGYYGGLQLTLQSWTSYGGTEYAARPDLASRSEQIAVAEKMLDALGPEAWPSCSMSAGLTGESAEEPDVDPGLPDGLLDLPANPAEDVPSAPTGGDESSSPAPSPSPSTSAGSAEPDASSEPTAEPDDPDDPDDDATGTPEASGTPQDDASPEAADGSAGDDAGQDRAEGGGRHRGSADTREDDAEHTSRGRHGRQDLPADTDDTAGAHVVRAGDTLSAIAEENRVDGGWPALFEANRETVGDDPDLILPGQVLHWDAHEAS